MKFVGSQPDSRGRNGPRAFSWAWLKIGLAVLALAGIWFSLRVIGAAVGEAMRGLNPGQAARSGP